MSNLVGDFGALSLHLKAAMQSRDPVRLLERALARIDAVEPQVRGFRVVNREDARRQAEQLAVEAAAGRPRGPLHGIPVAVKDVIDVAGLPTRAGSRTRETIAPAPGDATVVARLRAAGAVILGKAHTTEFAYFDGPPPTRNPHNPAHTPGGSSSGPAAVVAAGMVPLSLGTQTAGSVSRPAAYCGIAAFKPSTLAWPSFGVVPFAPSFDTVGVFGYRTADATLAARVLAPVFLPASPPAAARPLSLVLVQDPVRAAESEAVGRSIVQAGEALAASGNRVEVRASPVPFADILGWHKTVSEYELSRVQSGLSSAPAGTVTVALREAIDRGRQIEQTDYDAALRALDGAQAAFWPAMAGFDALIFPAAPGTPPAGMGTGDPRFIIPFTALGGPIASIPVGMQQGLPLGLMLAAAPGRDRFLADLAERVAPAIELPR